MADMALTRTYQDLVWSPPQGMSGPDAGKIVSSYLDAATTSFGRATHYNTRQEQQEAELVSHLKLLEMDRDLYVALMVLPGTLDRARQIGVKNLLGTPRNGDGFLCGEDERAVLVHLIQAGMTPARMLKMFAAMKTGDVENGIPKANNARTRKMILRTILGSPRLQLWAVKYLKLLKVSLTHAWGQRMTSIIGSILNKAPSKKTKKDQRILIDNVNRYVLNGADTGEVLQAVGFVLGIRKRLDLPLLKAFMDAKKDLAKGKKLPLEVLEGIRSTYHKDTPKEEIIKLTAKTMTKGQKLAVQKRAKAAGVKVEVDFLSQDAVKLYIYAFENGMTPEIRAALDKKAEEAAKTFPAEYGTIGILVDCSASMFGDKTQPLRPMATTLSLRDMLEYTAERAVVYYCGGKREDLGLVRPLGDTALADGLVQILQRQPVPETVFTLSDGYENAPAGRFAEVVDAIRDLGFETPIYHWNPVFAAEATGVRELASKQVPTFPASNPKAIASSMIRGLIEGDPVRGINALVQMALCGGAGAKKIAKT